MLWVPDEVADPVNDAGTGTPVTELNWVTLRGSLLIDASPVIAKLPPGANATCEWLTWKLTPLDEFGERSETFDQISVVWPAAGWFASTVVGAGEPEPATYVTFAGSRARKERL